MLPEVWVSFCCGPVLSGVQIRGASQEIICCGPVLSGVQVRGASNEIICCGSDLPGVQIREASHEIFLIDEIWLQSLQDLV